MGGSHGVFQEGMGLSLKGCDGHVSEVTRVRVSGGGGCVFERM